MAKPRVRSWCHRVFVKARCPAVVGALLVGVVSGPPGGRGGQARAEVLLAQRAVPLEQESSVLQGGRTDIRRQGSDEIVPGHRELELSSELAFVTTRSP